MLGLGCILGQIATRLSCWSQAVLFLTAVQGGIICNLRLLIDLEILVFTIFFIIAWVLSLWHVVLILRLLLVLVCLLRHTVVVLVSLDDLWLIVGWSSHITSIRHLWWLPQRIRISVFLFSLLWQILLLIILGHLIANEVWRSLSVLLLIENFAHLSIWLVITQWGVACILLVHVGWLVLGWLLRITILMSVHWWMMVMLHLLRGAILIIVRRLLRVLLWVLESLKLIILLLAIDRVLQRVLVWGLVGGWLTHLTHMMAERICHVGFLLTVVTRWLIILHGRVLSLRWNLIEPGSVEFVFRIASGMSRSWSLVLLVELVLGEHGLLSSLWVIRWIMHVSLSDYEVWRWRNLIFTLVRRAHTRLINVLHDWCVLLLLVSIEVSGHLPCTLSDFFGWIEVIGTNWTQHLIRRDSALHLLVWSSLLLRNLLESMEPLLLLVRASITAA